MGRHEFQDSTIEMVRIVLDSVKAAAQSKLDEAEKKLAAAFKDVEICQNAIEVAAATLAERTKTADDAKTEHVERTLARVAAAKEALALAEQEQTNGNAGLVVAEKKKQRLELGRETIYGRLKSGNLPD